MYRKHIVKVVRIDSDISCLGVFCRDEMVITCAHILRELKEPLLNSVATLEIYSPEDDRFMFYGNTRTADYCLDIMTLGENDLGISMKNPTRWDKSDNYFKLIKESPVPHRILISDENLFRATTPGYYFDKDGITKLKCDIIVDFSAFLTINCEKDIEAGCSGSPIFTNKNELIGILTNGFGPKEGQGVRIDIALPQVVLGPPDKLPTVEIYDVSKPVELGPEFDGWN